MACVITEAVVVLLHVKPQCVLPRVLLLRNYLKQEFGVEIRAYLSQMGDVFN